MLDRLRKSVIEFLGLDRRHPDQPQTPPVSGQIQDIRSVMQAGVVTTMNPEASQGQITIESIRFIVHDTESSPTLNKDNIIAELANLFKEGCDSHDKQIGSEIVDYILFALNRLFPEYIKSDFAENIKTFGQMYLLISLINKVDWGNEIAQNSNIIAGIKKADTYESKFDDSELTYSNIFKTFLQSPIPPLKQIEALSLVKEPCLVYVPPRYDITDVTRLLPSLNVTGITNNAPAVLSEYKKVSKGSFAIIDRRKDLSPEAQHPNILKLNNEERKRFKLHEVASEISMGMDILTWSLFAKRMIDDNVSPHNSAILDVFERGVDYGEGNLVSVTGSFISNSPQLWLSFIRNNNSNDYYRVLPSVSAPSLPTPDL
jgi:hypothetical protein